MNNSLTREHAEEEINRRTAEHQAQQKKIGVPTR